MPRGEQMGRQWKILQILVSSKTGKTVSDLAGLFDCTPRTIYRDLEALQKAGFPIYDDRVEGKKVWTLLERAKHHMPLPLEITELMALYFGRDMLKVLKHTVFYDSLKSLFQKIKALIPLEYIRYIQQIENNLHIGQQPYKQFNEFKIMLRSINQAIDQQKLIEIKYYTMSRKQETTRKVAPYNMWFFDSTFYLIGHCQLRDEIRMFAIDRIKSLSELEESFEMPGDFNAEEFMQESFGVFQGKPSKVKIRFSPEAAGYIKEKIWHETQKITDQKDGSIIFEANVAGIDEIKFWIMGWGAKARVLEPESLKRALLTEAKAILKNY